VLKSSTFGAKWFVTCIDDCIRVTWIFLTKVKFEGFNLFVKFFHIIRTQFEKSSKHLCSNNWREYVNHDMSRFLCENVGIHHNKMTLLKENLGIRHLLEVRGTLLLQMNVPKSY